MYEPSGGEILVSVAISVAITIAVITAGVALILNIGTRPGSRYP